ncbi:MAG TPA: hypothetical protein VF928_03190 [Usitatibacteraceae bacterium]
MKRPSPLSLFLPVMTALLVAGCTGSHVITGTVRAPLDSSQVTIYTVPPPKYEEVAIIDASSQMSLAVTEQGNMDVVMQRLKERAAALGANGVLLQGTGSASTGGIGGGVGGFGGNTAYGTGLSASINNKIGHGLAIYVPPPPEK